MHLFFVDESGSATPQDKYHSKNFVIGGVIIPEKHWHEIDKKLQDIKQEYQITSEIKWRYFAPHNKDNENGMKHLTFEQRNEVRLKLYDIITSYKSAKIISAIIDIDEAYKQKVVSNKDDLYCLGYYKVLDCFQEYLEDLSKNTGEKFNGMIIIDNRISCEDNRLRNYHYMVLNIDKKLNLVNNHLIEGLFIAPSHLSTGIQFADLIAGAIFRKYEKDDCTYYNKIENSIISPNGIIILPKNKKTSS